MGSEKSNISRYASTRGNVPLLLCSILRRQMQKKQLRPPTNRSFLGCHSLKFLGRGSAVQRARVRKENRRVVAVTRGVAAHRGAAATQGVAVHQGVAAHPVAEVLRGAAAHPAGEAHHRAAVHLQGMGEMTGPLVHHVARIEAACHRHQ